MFQGFSQGAVDFLWGIRFNSERSWFLAHKQEFLDLGITQTDYIIVIAGVVIMFIVSIIARRKPARQWIHEKPYIVRFILFVALLFATILFGQYGIGYDASAFIYNQF